MQKLQSKKMKMVLLTLSVIGVGTTAMIASAAETITYKYDAKGRVIKVERSGSVNNGVKTQYTHDKTDNRKKVTTTGSVNPAP